jgi:hypothetical protein
MGVGNVAYAVLIQVAIEPDSDRSHRHSILNDFVIPEAKTLPGFQKGTWMNNGAGIGTCLLVFKTEADARSALAPMTAEGGPPILNVGVYEIEVELEV